MKIEDPVGAVIRGHLYLESAFSRVLSRAVLSPDALALAKLSFNQMARMCCALGILAGDDVPCYLVLNKIRNRLAHELETMVTDADATALKESFSARQQSLFESPHNKQDVDDIRRSIRIMFISLLRQGENLDEQQVKGKALHTRVERLLARPNLRGPKSE
ncbi:MAG TPA: hypothetical protein VN934_05790 [Candidatus Tumulicola sp.]|nr:hypothetical protein [Candidatus Tumulicola sp.]